MILSLSSFPLPPSALCTIFGERSLPCPVTSCYLPRFLWALPVRPVLGVKGRQGNVLLWGGGSSYPVPSFPFRREILAQGGSLLVSVYLVLVVLATCSLLAHISQSGGGGGRDSVLRKI